MVVQAQTAAADGSLTGLTPDGDTLRVREVWQDNLEEEMKVRSGSNGQVRLSGWASAGLGSAARQRVLASLAQLIRDIVSDFPYLAMDTEFPGVVARPVGNFKNSGEYHYQTLRCVV